MSLTSYRESVRTLLQTATGITIVEGKIDGPVENADLGCIYPVSVGENPARVNEETYVVGVRLFKAFNPSGETSPKTPMHDPDPLEALLETCQATVKTNQVGLGMWFQRLTRADFDMDRNQIELTIVATTTNAGVL